MKIEGKNSLLELLKTEKTIDKVLVQNGLRDENSKKLVKELIAKGAKIQYVEKAVLDKETKTNRHQGFIAFVSDYEYYEFYDLINDLKNKTNSITLVLDGIEDPHNLGSIIRVAECSGVEGIVIGKRRQAQVGETVMRVSAGSANHVKVCRVTNINQAIEELKEAGVWAYALEVGGQNLYKTDLKGKIAIVVGGEDTGVNRLTKEKCDVIVSIPMFGKVNSLNASVATSIAVFESVRQRQNNV